MGNKVRESLEKRARQAILQHAIFRWESAVVIAASLLLAVIGPELLSAIPGWLYLIAGGAVEAAIVASSLTDPKTAERVVANMLRDEFQPLKLKDKTLQKQVAQALDYHSRIAAAARNREESVLKDSLNDTVGQLDEWMEDVYDLARRIDDYKKDQPLLRQSIAEARERVQELEKRRTREKAPRVMADIERNIEGLQRKIETTMSLENAMQRAELRLENTLIAMGTIYSQTMLAGAKDIDSSRAQRLRHDIAEEVNELGDILSAMDEVYASSQGAVAQAGGSAQP